MPILTYSELKIKKGENPSYSDLLSTLEWKTQRNNIVERDTLKCKKCKNVNVIKESVKAIIKDFYYESKHEIIATCLIFPELETIKIPLYFYKDPLIKTGSLTYYKIFDKNNSQINKITLISNKELESEIVTSHLVEDYKRETIQIWCYERCLEVHHKYYQLISQDPKKFILPWNYPSTAFETYCHTCHHELHESGITPVLFDENGDDIGFMSPCNRCNGTGTIPEYHYYMDGVCFECKGAQYTELM